MLMAGISTFCIASDSIFGTTRLRYLNCADSGIETMKKSPLRVGRSINVRFLTWDRLPACHFQSDRLEAYFFGFNKITALKPKA